MEATFYTLMVLFIFVCLFLILLILIQKGRGGGLASAFGGAGGNTAFGSKTGDVLTWATSIIFGNTACRNSLTILSHSCFFLGDEVRARRFCHRKGQP